MPGGKLTLQEKLGLRRELPSTTPAAIDPVLPATSADRHDASSLETTLRPVASETNSLHPGDRTLDAPAVIALLNAWQAAKAAVDARLSALRKTIASEADRRYSVLATIDVFSVGDAEDKQLTGSLRALAAQPPLEQARRQVFEALQAWERMLEQDAMVAVFESTPFSVSVPVRQALRPVLARIASGVSS